MKTHQFQSITEEQWKSGLSRHRCALCAYDYDDPVHSMSNWPLVITIEDCFVPQSAELVVTVAAEQSSETHAILWALAGMKASGEWDVN